MEVTTRGVVVTVVASELFELSPHGASIGRLHLFVKGLKRDPKG